MRETRTSVMLTKEAERKLGDQIQSESLVLGRAVGKTKAMAKNSMLGPGRL